MSKTWKWILGIFIALVVVGVIALAAWSFFTPRYGMAGEYQHPMMFERNDFEQFHGPMMRGSDNLRNPMGAYRNFRSPMMGSYGFLPWPVMLFGGLLRWLFPLGILALVGYFSYQKGKKDGMNMTVEKDVIIEKEIIEQPKPRGRKVASDE